MAAVDHPPVTARTRRLLGILLVPLLALLVAGAVSVWPTGDATDGLTGLGRLVHAEVTALREVTCTDTAPEAGVTCIRPLADLDDGGAVAVQDQRPLPDLRVGDHVVLRRSLDADGTPTYAVVGYDRGNLTLVLLVVAGVLLLLVARRRGLQVLVALALAGVVVRVLTLPAALRDADPLVLGLVTGGLVAVVLLVVGRGPGARSMTGLVGALLGLAATGAVAAAVGSSGNLGGTDADLATIAAVPVPEPLVVAGLVAAAAGVAALVAVDVVDGTWDLRGAAADARWWGVTRSGLRRSSERLAGAAATFALAVVGAGLGALALFAAPGAGLDPLVVEPVAGVLLTGLVGLVAIGLTAIATAALAALVAVREAGTTAPDDPRRFRAKAERELWDG
jgi:uncharacterized membrane protein